MMASITPRSSVRPWRFSEQGVSLAVRVTPRGGRDDIDGCETLADGRAVLKVRVRAIAESGTANAAVVLLLSKALGVPRSRIRISSGVTSRQKQIIIDGDPVRLGAVLESLTGPDRTG
jgi:uncharacterized protein (TIGR00251 family)